MVKHPNVVVKLSGKDGNAFSIMGRVRTALKRAGVGKGEIAEYTKQAMGGDYDNLLQVTMAWVEVV